MKVCYHQGRYGIEIMIEYLFRDRTTSWVRIVNGMNKYVTETSETIPLESVKHRVTVNLLAKSKLFLKLAVTLSSIPFAMNERRRSLNHKSSVQVVLEMSKFMIRLLRHDALARESDGAVKFDDLIGKIKAKFGNILRWTVEAWTKVLAEGGGPKKRFLYCFEP